MDLRGFDANKVDPAETFTPLPAGKYVALMSASESKTTKAGTGEYLECKWQIVEGEHKGRVLFSRLNLKNPNAQAVEIAQKELSSICRATNVMTPSDSHDFHNITIYLTVGVTKRKDTGALTNEVKGYASRKSAAEVPKRAAAAAGGVDDKPPW